MSIEIEIVEKEKKVKPQLIVSDVPLLSIFEYFDGDIGLKIADNYGRSMSLLLNYESGEAKGIVVISDCEVNRVIGRLVGIKVELIE